MFLNNRNAYIQFYKFPSVTKMQRKILSMIILLALSFSFAPGTMAQGKVALVANSIDIEMNPGLISLLREANLTVDYFETNDNGYTAYDYIIILGGPDSEGQTGELAKRILTENDQNTLRNRKYRLIYETSDFFKVDQKVFVLAGSDRDFTKVAVDQYAPQMISKITYQPVYTTTSKNLTAAQLKQLIDSKEEIYIIDLRKPEEFSKGHISGAVNIPYDKLGTKINEIPKDRKVVLYSDWMCCPNIDRTVNGAVYLAQKNFDNIYTLKDWYSVYKNLE